MELMLIHLHADVFLCVLDIHNCMQILQLIDVW